MKGPLLTPFTTPGPISTVTGVPEWPDIRGTVGGRVVKSHFSWKVEPMEDLSRLKGRQSELDPFINLSTSRFCSGTTTDTKTITWVWDTKATTTLEFRRKEISRLPPALSLSLCRCFGQRT